MEASQVAARQMFGRDGIHGLQTNRDMIHAFPACDHDFIAPATSGAACAGGVLDTAVLDTVTAAA